MRTRPGDALLRKVTLRALLVAATALAVAACGAGGGSPGADEPREDVAEPVDARSDAELAGTEVPDAEPAETGQGDAEAGAEDGVQPTVFAAVPGARCPHGSLVGTVQVAGSEWGPGLDAAAGINDRPDAWLPVEPALQDASCAFYPQPPPAFCGDCPPGTLCAPDATCQAMPAPLPGVTLTLSAGGEEQVVTNWGAVTLPGRTFAVTLAWDGLTVTLGPTAVPGLLEGASLTLSDSPGKPMALDVRWTPPPDGGTVFTRIPINHHAGSSTFTECAVEASAGSLHVDDAMLAPLAVATGLEFQGIEHARFAAAETPAGCVEIRFFVQQHPD
jgi:hypothetical protein